MMPTSIRKRLEARPRPTTARHLPSPSAPTTTTSSRATTPRWEPWSSSSGGPKDRPLDVRNFLIKDFGFGQACVDDGGTSKPERATADSGDVHYWVEKYCRNCGTSGIDGYISTMYYPDQDAMAAMVGTSSNDKQYDTLMKILYGIDIS